MRRSRGCTFVQYKLMTCFWWQHWTLTRPFIYTYAPVCNSRNISHERLMKKDTEVPFIQRYHSSVSHLRTNRENLFKTKVCSSGQVFMIWIWNLKLDHRERFWAIYTRDKIFIGPLLLVLAPLTLRIRVCGLS